MTTHVPSRPTPNPLLDDEAIARILSRIAHELIERNPDLGAVALVGIHTRGVPLARAAAAPDRGAERPRARRSARSTSPSTATTSLRGRRQHSRPARDRARLRARRPDLVLVDDVLYTGRTIRAAIDALFDHGRPARIQLAVLADRGHRELPIRPDYVGKNLPTARGERVQVELAEIDEADRVLLVPAPAEDATT